MKYPEQQLHRKQKKISGCVGQEVGTELSRGFSGGSVVKNPPAKVGGTRDTSSIPGSGRSPGEGNDNHSSILAWRILWTEPGRLKAVGLQESDMTE